MTRFKRKEVQPGQCLSDASDGASAGIPMTCGYRLYPPANGLQVYEPPNILC